MKNRIYKAIINSIVHPLHFVAIFRDAFKIPYPKYSDKDHLNAAISWLCRSQDKSKTGGCSEAYTFDQGWTPPYPETTGYIISTLLHYAKFAGNNEYVERAVRMGNWEIDIQLESGAVRGGVGTKSYPIVFNTGQVILGWTELYTQTKLERFLEASVRAADWLISIQDNDGKWSKFTYNETPHAYNSRVAWSLLKVYKHTQKQKYKEAAEKNILWVLSQSHDNGWFNSMAFTEDEVPLTHTIAYTIRGLLECSYYFEGALQKRIHDAVELASENIMRRYELRKKDPYSMPRFLPGRLDEKWRSATDSSCLTGNAQIVIIWLKLYMINSDARYLNSSLKVIDQLKTKQSLKSLNRGIRGGIPGSYPIWGDYFKYGYPNWAAKFYADSLMLLDTIMKDKETH